MERAIILSEKQLANIIEWSKNIGMYEGLYKENLVSKEYYEEQKELSERKIVEMMN